MKISRKVSKKWGFIGYKINFVIVKSENLTYSGVKAKISLKFVVVILLGSSAIKKMYTSEPESTKPLTEFN